MLICLVVDEQLAVMIDGFLHWGEEEHEGGPIACKIPTRFEACISVLVIPILLIWTKI
jgi:hypothetical protein